jgi:hypothetical protein
MGRFADMVAAARGRPGVQSSIAQGTSNRPFQSDAAFPPDVGTNLPVHDKETPPYPAKAWPQFWTRILPGLAESGRGEQLRTDAELQTGPAPGRIPRPETRNIGAMIGAGTGTPVGVSGFPYNGDMAYIVHQKIIRGTKNPSLPARTIDDNAHVPALYAGNPR